MTLHESFVLAFQKAVDKEGNLNKFAHKVGLNYSTLYRWLNESQSPTLKDLESLLPFIDWLPYDKAMSENTEINQLKIELERERDRVALLKDILTSKPTSEQTTFEYTTPIKKIG